MHLTLTDRLTCPRCGPTAGLVLFMDEVEERRVVRGSLGCPRCGARYPIEQRVADLRLPPTVAEPTTEPTAATAPEAQPTELAMRVAGLLGLLDGAGFVLLDGPHGLDAALALRSFAPDVEPVVAIPPGRAAEARGRELSALLEPGALPLAGRAMGGVAWLGGVPSAERLRELVRVCRPTGRLLLDAVDSPAPSMALDAAGMLLSSLKARIEAADRRALLAVVR